MERSNSASRLGRALAAAGLVASSLVVALVMASPASAAPALSSSPSANLKGGESLNVSVTGLTVGTSYALTQCGNADAAGNPLPGAEPAETDCFGAADIGAGKVILRVNSPATTWNTPYPFSISGIGTEGRTCIANSAANFDCQLVLAQVNLATLDATPVANFSLAVSEDPLLIVEPNSGLKDGQKVTVIGRNLLDIEGLAVTIVQCGNADKNGKALAGDAPGEDDCAAEAVTATVTEGGFSTQYTVRESGIGPAGRTCIEDGNFACQIQMAGQPVEGDPIVLSTDIAFAVPEPEPEPTPTPTTTPPAAPAQPVVLSGDKNRSLAFTGSGTTLTAMVGGAVLAFGILLTVSARRLRREEARIDR